MYDASVAFAANFLKCIGHQQAAQLLTSWTTSVNCVQMQCRNDTRRHFKQRVAQALDIPLSDLALLFAAAPLSPRHCSAGLSRRGTGKMALDQLFKFKVD